MMITFGIITNGKRPEKLQKEIASIRRLGVPEYELILCGAPPQTFPAPTLEHPDLAETSRLGAMRNCICDAAQGEIISITDDDIYYAPDWHQRLTEFHEFHGDWDVLCTRLLNPDGSRNWDWVTKGGPRGHILIEYWETDPYLYITGGRIILKRHVAEKCRWDDNLGFNQEEDVRFSRLLQSNRYRIILNKAMIMVHDDPTYTSKGHLMYRVGG